MQGRALIKFLKKYMKVQAEFVVATILYGMKITNYISQEYLDIRYVNNLIIVILFTCLLFDLKIPKRRIPKISVFIYLLFFIYYAIGAILGTESQSQAFIQIINMIVLSLLILLFTLNQKIFNLFSFFKWLFIYSIILALIIYNERGINRLEMSELIGFGPIYISRIGSYIFCFSILLWRHKLLTRLGVVLGLFLMLYGASRGPVIAVCLYLLITLLRSRKVVSYAWASIVISITAIIGLKYAGSINLLMRLQELRSGGLSETTRFERYEVFVQKFYLIMPFGGGSLSWGRIFWDKLETSFSHSIVLDHIVEFGLFGIVILVWLVQRSFYLLKSSQEDFTLVFPILFTLISGSFFSNVEYWFFIAIAPLIGNYVVSRKVRG